MPFPQFLSNPDALPHSEEILEAAASESTDAALAGLTLDDLIANPLLAFLDPNRSKSNLESSPEPTPIPILAAGKSFVGSPEPRMISQLFYKQKCQQCKASGEGVSDLLPLFEFVIWFRSSAGCFGVNNYQLFDVFDLMVLDFMPWYSLSCLNIY